MIQWRDVYQVVEATAPLYLALVLGYGSVKWWRMFTADQCSAINRFICYFVFPFYGFNFVSHVDPFSMNFRYLGADVASKFIIVLGLGLWCKCSCRTDSLGWFVTCYSISTMCNNLFVGVPLIDAMYGPSGVHLVAQAIVLQTIVYSVVFLILLDFWKSFVSCTSNKEIPGGNSVGVAPVGTTDEVLEGRRTTEMAEETQAAPSFWPLMKIALHKLGKNPNIYGCVLGLIWAFLAKWLHIGMPKIVEGSIKVMSAGGISTAMFSLGAIIKDGFFMAMQRKVLVCGVALTVLGLTIRFIAAPLAMGIGAFAFGLRGDVLRIAILQAAMPQSLASFIFANEYGLHADVMSTVVMFGMIICVPLLIAYYAILSYIYVFD